MAKGKDFYGKDVTEVIARACKELSAAQGDLDIEVLETGSAGIFGLCKKKAHIRVTRKGTVQEQVKPVAREPEKAEAVQEEEKPSGPRPKKPAKKKQPSVKVEKSSDKKQEKAAAPAKEKKEEPAAPKPGEKKAPAKDPAPRELPSEEVLATVQQDTSELLKIMGFASEVAVKLVDGAVECRISKEYQEALVGSEGRTLDSLQYLLRKMMSGRLPDRMMLSLDVGDYRERRALELTKRARELAEQVKEDGKTQAIAALNPSERRVVHMVLQEDKAIRSRSVGEGLFKKVLIYKPGKKNKSNARKGKGRQGGRSSGNK
jgi:spoIIIJ-associated protein